MDYYKQLEQSIKNFDQEIDKLSQISNLTDEIAWLVSDIEQEKKFLEQSITKLNTIEERISENCGKLSRYLEHESEERKKLTAEIHNAIIQNVQQIISAVELVKSDMDKISIKRYEMIERKIVTLNDNLDGFIHSMNEDFPKSLKKLNAKVNSMLSDVKELKENTATLNYVKTAINVAIVIGIIDIGVNFLR